MQALLTFCDSSREWRVHAIVRLIVFTAAISIAGAQAFAANPKKVPKDPAKEPAKETAKPVAKGLVGPKLPADLNLASMRVKALDELYELDLSTEQLKAFRAAASGAASPKVNSPAKGAEKLAPTLQEFQGALLERKDDKQIDELRNKIADLVDDDDVQLDDDVQISASARAKAADTLKQLTASQLAAFLAAHADEVGDPVEMMIGATSQLHLIRASSSTESDAKPDRAAASESAPDSPSDAADLVQDTSLEVGELVAGLDDTKAKSIASAVAKWINSNSSMKEDEFSEKRKSLVESARTIVGNIHPMRVLDNWLERRLASLLSNPQLPDAIDAILQFKQAGN